MKYILPVLLFLLVSVNAGAYTWVGSQAGKAHGSATEIYNVRDYGAVGDNSTDDTVAIQAAITAACAAVQASESTPQVRIPTGVFKVTSPIFLQCANGPVALQGNGYRSTFIHQTSTSPTLIVSTNLTYPNGINLTVGSNIIPSGSGSSLAYSASPAVTAYFDLNEVLGLDSSTPKKGPFNGLTAFDIRMHIKPSEVTANHCLWASDGGLDFKDIISPNTSMSAPAGIAGFLCQGSDAKLYGALNIGGTMALVNSGATTMTNGTEYEVEMNYDNATGNLNLYLGSTTVNRVAQTTGLSGAIVQRADENNVLGADVVNWPPHAPSIPWAGSLQSVQISNTARNTAASYAETTADYSTDANTLFLMNLSLSTFPNGHPAVQVEKPTPAWLALHNTGTGCCGGDFILKDFTINGGNLAIFANAANLDMDSVIPASTGYIGLETSANATFGTTIKNIPQYDTAGGNLTGMMVMGGITSVRDVTLPAAKFAGVFGPGQYSNIFFQTNTLNTCGIVFDNENLNNTYIDTLIFDSENGGDFHGVCIQNPGANFTISHSSIQLASSSTAASYPIALFADANGGESRLTLENNNFRVTAATLSILDATHAVRTANGSVSPPDWIADFRNNTYCISSTCKDTPQSPTRYTNNGLQYNISEVYQQATKLESSAVPRVVSATTQTCFASPCTVNYPSNLVAGRVLAYAHNTGSTAGATVTMPTGWVTGCTFDDHASSNVFWHTFTKVITANDVLNGSMSVTFTGAGQTVITQLSGVNRAISQGTCYGVHGASSTAFALTGGAGTDQNSLVMDYVDVGTGAISYAASGTLPQDFFMAGIGAKQFSYLPRSATIPTVNFTAVSALTWGGLQVEYLPEITTTALQPINYGAAVVHYGQSQVQFGGLTLTPMTLAKYPACTTTTEGSYGTQTDSAVACVAGVTAAAGGTTHCQMYCNGTNWLRTGL